MVEGGPDDQHEQRERRDGAEGDVEEQDDLQMMSFDEIAARQGEEAAINAGIAADPDSFELDYDWFERAGPAIEADAVLAAG
ncbi:MAG: hypothetical protein OXC31_00955 [Spirochaetaceae bacterium]|nr:hypothetical protein [Spirochaetaceae bacterium]